MIFFITAPNTACTRQKGSTLGSSRFRQSGVVSSRPPAGNANRWAARERSAIDLKDHRGLVYLAFGFIEATQRKSVPVQVWRSSQVEFVVDKHKEV